MSDRQDSNIVERSLNHFAVETRQYILCVVVELHVTVHQIMSVAQQCYTANLWRQQDTQRTYDIILRRVRATIVAVENQLVLHFPRVCVRSLRRLV